MNERHQDFELLQRFTRQGEQAAFGDVVRRHLDLVFATALRKVEDPGAAQEISQNVFGALARKAWRFAPDDSLPAWLHKTALLESKSWLRGELRRRRREAAAAELGTTMNTPQDQPAFQALLPLLDEALLSLREKDRTALLLRFYESNSLRDVGTAFGISEDTARKRVQSALEKVAEFFKRRGFKTATVAAAAAALQHTTVSTSAAMGSTIIGAVLKTAPPALAGLGTWLARLCSLTRTQTAAMCVALAAVPLGWQLNEHHTARERAAPVKAQLLAAENQAATLQAEIDRLRTQSARLEQSLAQANEAAARAAEAAQAFEAWKKKTRSQLMAADYRWDDDSAFARIPKAVLPELIELARNSPFSPPGVVNPYARELMGLTRTESQAIEDILHRMAEAQSGEPAEVYETDSTIGGRTVASKIFSPVPFGKVGAEAEQHLAPMVTELIGLFGEGRWAAMPYRFRSSNCDTWNHELIPQLRDTLTAWVEADNRGIATAMWTFTGNAPAAKSVKPATSVKPAKSGEVYSMNVVGYMSGGAALSGFLSDADPVQTKGAVDLGEIGAPEALRRRALRWFKEQATARLGQKEQP